jgi:hydroxyethylthiazole kinase-like uncharacterized protein yjeF
MPTSDGTTGFCGQPVLTVAQMRAAEAAAIEAGASEWDLMLRAGEGAAEFIWRVSAGRPVIVLCGPGNNGGDGYVIAESLRARSGTVHVIAAREAGTECARKARAGYSGTVLEAGAAVRGDVLVDCLFGYGLSRPLGGDLADLLVASHRRHATRVAIDVPSIVECDTGAVIGPDLRYDATLALGAWKYAHVLEPARVRCGMLELVELPLGPLESGAALAGRPVIEPPSRDAHKYTRGVVGIVAGPMGGAATLAAEGAMRAGAGYVRLLSNGSHRAAPAALVIDATPIGEAMGERRLDAVLVGPGLGRDAAAAEKLRAVIASRRPCVLDADALMLLTPELLEAPLPPNTVLTPHSGELSVLAKAFSIEGKGKCETARSLARALGAFVLAKGPDSVLAKPDGCLTFFPGASRWLSTAGTGDVLAGLIAARLATGQPPRQATTAAIFLHREAARLAGPSFTADDLAQQVSRALQNMLPDRRCQADSAVNPEPADLRRR